MEEESWREGSEDTGDSDEDWLSNICEEAGISETGELLDASGEELSGLEVGVEEAGLLLSPSSKPSLRFL